jgi:hypothetical protein
VRFFENLETVNTLFLWGAQWGVYCRMKKFVHICTVKNAERAGIQITAFLKAKL